MLLLCLSPTFLRFLHLCLTSLIMLLYWWPEVGWQLGRVARLSKRAPFSHVVRYRRPAATFAGDVDTLLDTPSYGTRWVLLAPARA